MTSSTTTISPSCPHCSDRHPYRWGREHGSQRYRCRGCLKTFTLHTGTPLARLRHRDRLHTYAAATADRLGVRRTARACRVAAATIHRWRHRITPDAMVKLAPPPVAGVISLFSGVGALDLGFERAGFRSFMANEISPSFANAYVQARAGMDIPPPRHGVIIDSAESFLGPRRRQLEAAMHDARAKHGLVGFIGGPPCPDFSIAGKQGGGDGDHGRLTKVYADLIAEMQPDFFLFENVKGLWSTARHREFYRGIRLQLESAGYALADRLVNALDYGAPQDRQRVILIGFRRNSFGAADVMASGFRWDAYASDLDAFAAPWPGTAAFNNGGRRNWPRRLATRYRPLTVQHWFDRNEVERHPNGGDHFEPQGGLRRMQTVAEGDTSCKSFKRLHRWRYSPTAAYGNNEVHLHPWKPRRLSVAETMAIQSLPREFALPEDMTLSDKFKAIGNAVPMKLAEAMAGTVADCLST